jgi:hypothetical protein
VTSAWGITHKALVPVASIATSLGSRGFISYSLHLAAVEMPCGEAAVDVDKLRISHW